MKKRLKVAVDVDDVLASCNEQAINLLNKEKGTSYTLYDVVSWGLDDKTAERVKFFSSEEFVRNQPVSTGARRFVRELIARNCDVFCVTAVPTAVVAARAEWIRKNFPEIPESNICLSQRKDICNVDVLIDDAPHNVLKSPAKYPILYRRPWNKNVTGLMSVNNFDEALNFIDTILHVNNYVTKQNASPEIFCLVAPSGSEKTEIVDMLRKTGKFDVPVIETTSYRTNDYYVHVEKEQFISNAYVETTAYAGDYYGTTDENIISVFEAGKKVVIPIDIGGANALRKVYGNTVVTIYISKPKEELIRKILAKDISDDCKTLRITALDYEMKNADLCDIDTDFMSNQEIVDMILGM